MNTFNHLTNQALENNPEYASLRVVVEKERGLNKEDILNTYDFRVKQLERDDAFSEFNHEMHRFLPPADLEKISNPQFWPMILNILATTYQALKHTLA